MSNKMDSYPAYVQQKFNDYYKLLHNELNWPKVLPKYFDMRRLKKVHGAYYANCILHKEEHDSLRFSYFLQMFHCYGCSIGGNVFNFIERMESDRFAAMLFIRKHFGIPLPFTRKEWRAVKRYMIMEAKISEINAEFLEYTAKNWKDCLVLGNGPREEKEAIANFLLSYEECRE